MRPRMLGDAWVRPTISLPVGGMSKKVAIVWRSSRWEIGRGSSTDMSRFPSTTFPIESLLCPSRRDCQLFRGREIRTRPLKDVCQGTTLRQLTPARLFVPRAHKECRVPRKLAISLQYRTRRRDKSKAIRVLQIGDGKALGWSVWRSWVQEALPNANLLAAAVPNRMWTYRQWRERIHHDRQFVWISPPIECTLHRHVPQKVVGSLHEGGHRKVARVDGVLRTVIPSSFPDGVPALSRKWVLPSPHGSQRCAMDYRRQRMRIGAFGVEFEVI